MEFPQRSSYAEIDLDAFRWNFRQIEKQVGTAKIAAVVKANAYGHGVEEISREALKLGAEYLCVAYVQEGLELRKKGFTSPIAVFTPPVTDEIAPALENNLEMIAHSFEAAEEIDKIARKAGKTAVLQINVDTGMHRTGIFWEYAADEMVKIHKLENCEIRGMFTHFATADWADLTFAYEQLNRFNSVVEKLPFRPEIIHTSNSGAILQMKETYFNMVRPGISIYGYYPSLLCKHTLFLKPVMTLKSYVAHVRRYKKGERFSYSLTYEIEKDTEIATLPLGYADGINRLLSNSGNVVINEKRYPIVGVVSMDSILIDVGTDSGVRQGDEAVLLGRQGNTEVSINEWCEKLNTIPYEVTCNVSSRMPRIYVNR